MNTDAIRQTEIFYSELLCQHDHSRLKMAKESDCPSYIFPEIG